MPGQIAWIDLTVSNAEDPAGAVGALLQPE